MYGNKNFDNNMNIKTLAATMKLAKDSERSDQPLFQPLLKPFLLPSPIPVVNILLKEVRCYLIILTVFLRYRFCICIVNV